MKQAGHPFSVGSSSVPGGPLGVAGGPGDPIGRQVCTQPCQQYLLILVHPLVLQGALTVSFLVRPSGTRTPRIIIRDGQPVDSSFPSLGFASLWGKPRFHFQHHDTPTPSPTGPSAALGTECLITW